MYVEYLEGEKHAAIGADVSESCEAFKDAGWILEDTDYVIDIDTLPKETIKELMFLWDKDSSCMDSEGLSLVFQEA